ncbi:hypothetical protein LCGC14_0788640 [marine sediment metagenome]|uniref:Uncharacterized protein n=1 Tax=marine sediment metagenome TaxID=412755 RepID=A0A0F9T0A9_9ZZZZ
MKKPEKKFLTDNPELQGSPMEMENMAYNQGRVDMEAYHNYVLSKKEEELKEALAHQELELWTRHQKYWLDKLLSKLPTEGEIITEINPFASNTVHYSRSDVEKLAKAIYKRQQNVKEEE